MKNKSIISITFFIILGMIVFPTIYKVYTGHNNKLLLVVEKEFLYQASICYKEDKCPEDIIYLKDLYENNYITDKLTNPLTKKYYEDKSFVNIKTNEVKLIS